MASEEQTKFDRDSRFDEYDLNNDGIVSDLEIDQVREMKEAEDASRKHMAQLRLARYSLMGMGVYTILLFMPFVSDKRIELLTAVSDLLYISLCSVVCAFMGFTSYMSRK